MAHDINIPDNLRKEEKYSLLRGAVSSLISDETDIIAILSNVSAAIQETFNFLWVGFYLVKDKELVLGPFQGPVACFRIKFGQGVCGTSWKNNKSIIVPDVDNFPGHIACSSRSKSEIVIPIRKENEVFAILDIDSSNYNDFEEIDEKYLKEIIKLIEDKLILTCYFSFSGNGFLIYFNINFCSKRKIYICS